jgi:hypothetical protein
MDSHASNLTFVIIKIFNSVKAQKKFLVHYFCVKIERFEDTIEQVIRELSMQYSSCSFIKCFYKSVDLNSGKRFHQVFLPAP